MKRNLNVLIIIQLTGCASGNIDIRQEIWGETRRGQVYHYTVTNVNGMVMQVTNYGAIITSVLVPDKNGEFEDVVLGFDNLLQYLDPNPCFGAAIGRFANRIKDGRFTINDSLYQLAINDGKHCIHGANEFDRVVFTDTSRALLGT